VSSLQEAAFLLTLEIESNWNAGISFDAKGNQVPGNPVLSHRWNVTQNIDRDFATKYVRRGLIRIASDGKLGLDAARESLIVTGIQPGCVRLGSSYTVQEDGLAMS
jgi:hypothetical protein